MRGAARSLPNLGAGEATAAFEHSGDFRGHLSLVLNVHSDVVAPNVIERGFSEGQVEGVGLPEFDAIRHPAPTGQLPCNFDELRREVDTRHAAAACRSDDTRATADAAPEVHHVHARLDTSALDMRARSLGTAAVELIEWKEILVGRTLRVDTSLQEKRGHAIQDSAHAVMLPYCVGAVCHNSPPLSGRTSVKLDDKCNLQVTQCFSNIALNARNPALGSATPTFT